MMREVIFKMNRNLSMSLRHTHCLGNKYLLDIQILEKKTPFLQSIPLVLDSVHVR